MRLTTLSKGTVRHQAAVVGVEAGPLGRGRVREPEAVEHRLHRGRAERIHRPIMPPAGLELPNL